MGDDTVSGVRGDVVAIEATGTSFSDEATGRRRPRGRCGRSSPSSFSPRVKRSPAFSNAPPPPFPSPQHSPSSSPPPSLDVSDRSPPSPNLSRRRRSSSSSSSPARRAPPPSPTFLAASTSFSSSPCSTVFISPPSSFPFVSHRKKDGRIFSSRATRASASRHRRRALRIRRMAPSPRSGRPHRFVRERHRHLHRVRFGRRLSRLGVSVRARSRPVGSVRFGSVRVGSRPIDRSSLDDARPRARPEERERETRRTRDRSFDRSFDRAPATAIHSFDLI